MKLPVPVLHVPILASHHVEIFREWWKLFQDLDSLRLLVLHSIQKNAVIKLVDTGVEGAGFVAVGLIGTMLKSHCCFRLAWLRCATSPSEGF